jgi:hypothetical protein
MSRYRRKNRAKKLIFATAGFGPRKSGGFAPQWGYPARQDDRLALNRQKNFNRAKEFWAVKTRVIPWRDPGQVGKKRLLFAR